MPRSFMINHRRFGEDDLNGIIISNSSSNKVEKISEVSDDRMHPDSPVRSYMSYFPDSPEFKKRPVFPCRGLDKSVSVSDGESDSGCSSQTDARNELPPELEYTLGCPSGFSLLLELMTQSPQRYSSQEILDLNICNEVKSPGQRLVKEDPEKGKLGFDLGQISKLEIYPGQIERIENTNMHIHICPENEHGVKAIDHGRYIFEASENRKGLTEVVYSKDGDYSVCVDRTRSRDTSGVLGDQVSSQTTPIYDFQIYNEQEIKPNHIQRRISFDEDMGSMQKAKMFTLSESQDDQPIDYSQLSSRRKENTSKRPLESTEVCNQDIIYMKEEPMDKTRKTSDGMYSTVKKIITGQAAMQKYEFILSPKMDGNGNLVLSQPHAAIDRTVYEDQEREYVTKGNDALHSLPSTLNTNEILNGKSNYAQHCSALSGSPASPLHCSSDTKQETALDIAKAKFEPNKYHQDNGGINKAQLTYHPKLKYLLAVSQYAKNKITQDDGPVPSAATSYPSYQPNLLFSQNNQKAQADKFTKLSDHNQNIYTRSEVGHEQRIPSSELFHARTNAPHCNHDNANVFILNPTSTFKSGTSSIDISKGSPVNDKQQITADIHSPHSISPSCIQISNSFNGSHTSDHLQCETSQETPDGMYSTSPGPPLSPASLRDQQAALSELLFSTNRKSGVDPYACVDCAKRYSTSSNLARHRQTHRSVCDKKARKCPHCDKVYVSMPAFSMHVRTHNQGCECPHCGKKFSRPWLLQGHIRTHTGEKPFGCPQCGKSFADKSNLRAHIQTHSTEKPYVCGRCGKAFALKSYLYKHEESSCMRGQRFRH